MSLGPESAPHGESSPESPSEPRAWWLYLLRSSSRTRTYVGITVDLERRLTQHNGELPGGAKSTRAGRPWLLTRSWGPFEHGQAARLEVELKRRRGSARERWEPSTASLGE